MDTIEIADTCMLNSGGAAMTVTGAETVDGRRFLRVCWQDRDCKPHAASFRDDTLVLVSKREDAQQRVRDAHRVLQAE